MGMIGHVFNQFEENILKNVNEHKIHLESILEEVKCSSKGVSFFFFSYDMHCNESFYDFYYEHICR